MGGEGGGKGRRGEGWVEEGRGGRRGEGKGRGRKRRECLTPQLKFDKSSPGITVIIINRHVYCSGRLQLAVPIAYCKAIWEVWEGADRHPVGGLCITANCTAFKNFKMRQLVLPL